MPEPRFRFALPGRSHSGTRRGVDPDEFSDQLLTKGLEVGEKFDEIGQVAVLRERYSVVVPAC